MTSALTKRQETLLSALIKEYIRAAHPISSGLLVERRDFDLSPATLRHNMVELEDAGYLEQPHTSAGRIPTERAWHWYINRDLADKPLRPKERQHLADVVRAARHSQAELMRRLAKAMAELSGETVLVAFDKDDLYYTGLSNLFRQPEFEEVETLYSLSRIVDHLDDVMARVFDRVEERVQVLVGRDNPFSPACGTVVARYAIPHQSTGVLGILGPLRQDYDEHVALVRYTQELLQTL